MANYPGSLPSATPSTHQEVVDEIGAMAAELQPAWTSYAAALTAGVLLSTSTADYTFKQVGKQLTGQGYAILSGPGTASQYLTAALPAQPRRNSNLASLGSFTILRGTTVYTGTVTYNASTLLMRFQVTGQTDQFGVAPAVTMASGDIVSWTLSYEVP